jgi:hypothetical protein
MNFQGVRTLPQSVSLSNSHSSRTNCAAGLIPSYDHIEQIGLSPSKHSEGLLNRFLSTEFINGRAQNAEWPQH